MEVSEDELQQLMASGNTMLKKGETMDPEQLKAMQNQGPSAKDISQGMQQGFDAIKDMRADADVPKRLEIAESCKTDANEKLAAGSPANALKSYLVGIWLLMRGDPEPTRSLVAPVATERDAKIALGVGADGMTDVEAFGESYAQQVGDLRTALHLNVAAATLKLNMFVVASLACGVVLKEQPQHPKALFRLAKAGDGTGDLAGAIATLGKLLKVEGQADNNEARKLLQTLKARKAKEAKIYGGFFERAREDGGSLYGDAEQGAGNAKKLPDLKKGSEEQDARNMKDILARLPNHWNRLPPNVQKELRQMSKVGVSPTEFVKAYRRFLKDELKGMARDTVPEELSEIMSVMQASEEKMEAVLDKVKSQIEVRKSQPWRVGAGGDQAAGFSEQPPQTYVQFPAPATAGFAEQPPQSYVQIVAAANQAISEPSTLPPAVAVTQQPRPQEQQPSVEGQTTTMPLRPPTATMPRSELLELSQSAPPRPPTQTMPRKQAAQDLAPDPERLPPQTYLQVVAETEKGSCSAHKPEQRSESLLMRLAKVCNICGR